MVAPYSPGVDDLSAAGVAPPAGRARRVLTPPRDSRGYWWAGLVLFLLAAAFLGLTAIMAGIIALTLAIVYLPRLFRRR